MIEALQMGKYGLYVWSSFGLVAIVMITCIVQARTRQSRVYKDVANRVRAMETTE